MMSFETYQEKNLDENSSDFSQHFNSLKKEIGEQKNEQNIKSKNWYIDKEQYSKGKIIIPPHIIGIAKENIKNGDVIDNVLLERGKRAGSDFKNFKNFISKERLINICHHFMDKATVATFNIAIESNYLIDQFGKAILDLNFFEKKILKKSIESGLGKSYEQKCRGETIGILSILKNIINQVLGHSIIATKKVYKKIPRKDGLGVNTTDYPVNYKGPDKYERITISVNSPRYICDITPIGTNMDRLSENLESPPQLKKILIILNKALK